MGTGGAERSNADLWYFLKIKGVTIKIIILEHRKEGIEKEILKAGFDVVFLKKSNFFKQCFQIARLVKREKPDFVHSVLFRASIRTRFAKLFASFLHIESLVNESYSAVRFQDPRVNKWALMLYKYLDAFTQVWATNKFLAITELVKNHYVQKLGYPPEKVKVIYRGRAENQYIHQRKHHKETLHKEFSIPNSFLVLIQVGRQEYQKGHLITLKAVKELYDRDLLDHVHFLFCGREGNATLPIKQFVDKYPAVNEYISWAGHRSDIPELLAGSDVFLFPSRYEGLGGALIEAQAAALPVICSNLKVFEEVVQKDSNALTFKNGDHHEFAEKIFALIKNEAKREEMRDRSLVHFYKKFLLEKINEKTLTFYKSLL